MEVKEFEKMIREQEGSLSLAFPALMRNACRVLTEVQVTMHVEEGGGNIGHFRSFRHYRNAC